MLTNFMTMVFVSKAVNSISLRASTEVKATPLLDWQSSVDGFCRPLAHE